MYGYECIDKRLDLLHASDCARSQQHFRLLHFAHKHRAYTDRRNRSVLCESSKQCSVAAYKYHAKSFQFAAIYCCHQTTNFFAQYASACYASRNCASLTCCCCCLRCLLTLQAPHSNPVFESCTCVFITTHKQNVDFVDTQAACSIFFYPKSFSK